MAERRRVVAGAGGFGRELASFVRSDPAMEWVGFLADEPPSVASATPYLGRIGDPVAIDVPMLVGVGYPRGKHAVITSAEAAGRSLAPAVVHASATLGPRVELAAAVVVGPGAVATIDIALGRATTVHPGAMLGHDVRCLDYVSIMPGAVISGNVTLGQGAFVGANATILQGVHVGEWATIGAGAVVTRDVAPGTTVVGVPAQARDRQS